MVVLGVAVVMFFWSIWSSRGDAPAESVFGAGWGGMLASWDRRVNKVIQWSRRKDDKVPDQAGV